MSELYKVEIQENKGTYVEKNGNTFESSIVFNLGDIIYTSTLDWPGKVVMVIFTRTCPFYCVYCSNSKFLRESENYDDYFVFVDKILKEIELTKDYVDGVVLSGGEPLYQDVLAIFEIANYVKEANLLLGIQTNGVEPNKIRALADNKLLDAIFLDIKAPLRNEKYCKIVGNQNKIEINDPVNLIKETLEFCGDLQKNKLLKYFEVRTTVFPQISDSDEDIKEIVSSIEYCDAYVIQQGRPEIAFKEYIKDKDVVSREKLFKLATVALNHKRSGVKTIKVRTHTFGDEIVN